VALTLIPHSIVKRSTEISTSSSVYSDVDVLTSGNFVAGRKYLIIATYQWIGANTINDWGIRIRHGATVFPTSDGVMEVANDGIDFFYSCAIVHTAVAGEDIALEFAALDNIGPLTVKRGSILAIELTPNLIENTDWFYNENLTSTSLPAGGAFTTTNNATFTFTPANANDKWLVLAGSIMNPANADKQYITQLRRTGQAPSPDDDPVFSQEGEDIATDRIPEFVARTYDLLAVSNTFESRSSVESGGTGDRINSYIFAINLSKFASFAEQFIQGTITIDDSDDYANATEVATATINKISSLSDVFYFGRLTKSKGPDNTGDKFIKCRGQYDNVDEPPGITAEDERQLRGFDEDDQLCPIFSSIMPLGSGSHTIDLDATTELNGTGVVGDRLAVLFELALDEAAETEISVDAILVKKQTETITNDAILLQVNAETILVDARLAVRREVLLDAFLVNRQTETILVDSILVNRNTVTSTVDSILVNQNTETITADSIIKAIQTNNVSIDATLEQAKQNNVSVDSILVGTKLQILVDAILGMVIPITVDSILVNRIQVLIDGIIVNRNTETILVDSLLRKQQTNNVTNDSILVNLFKATPTVDTVLKRIVQEQDSLDAIIIIKPQATITVDAERSFSFLELRTVDAILLAIAPAPLVISVDAILDQAGIADIIIDGFLRAQNTATANVDVTIETPKVQIVVTSDAIIVSTPTASPLVDAKIVIRSIESILADSILINRKTLPITLDGLVRLTSQIPVSVDATISLPLTVASIIDSILVNRNTAQAIADANLLFIIQEQVSVDSNLRARIPLGISVDSAIRLLNVQESIQVDSLIALGPTQFLVANARLLATPALGISIDGLIIRSVQITLDAKLGVGVVPLPILVDASLRIPRRVRTISEIRDNIFTTSIIRRQTRT